MLDQVRRIHRRRHGRLEERVELRLRALSPAAPGQTCPRVSASASSGDGSSCPCSRAATRELRVDLGAGHPTHRRPRGRQYLKQIEEAELSDAFWSVTLPAALETTSTVSPFFQTFLAAQVASESRGFLSKSITVAAMHPAVRRHPPHRARRTTFRRTGSLTVATITRSPTMRSPRPPSTSVSATSLLSSTCPRCSIRSTVEPWYSAN